MKEETIEGGGGEHPGERRRLRRIRELLRKAAGRSTCHAIRLGVVIEAPQNPLRPGEPRRVLGWNGPPSGAGEHRACLLGRYITPENIRRCPSVHAEVRAICRAALSGTPIEGGTLYLSEWFCCAPCAAAMIEAGIRSLVVTEEIDYSKDDCYNFRLAEELLEKAGVGVEIARGLKIT